jgi:hypothetical protein
MKLRHFRNASLAKMTNRRITVIDSPDGDGFYIKTRGLYDSDTPTSNFLRRGKISESTLRISDQSAFALITLLAIRMGISVENDVNADKIHIYRCTPKSTNDDE